MAGRLGVLPFAFALASGAAAVHGCTIMNGLTVPAPDAGAPDAAADAAKDPCDHAYAPFDPPQIPEDGELSFTTAIRDIDFGVDGPDAGVLTPFPGFDLDRTCTCPGPSSCTGKTRVCDDTRGQDNALATLLRQLATKQLDVQANTREALSKGANGALVIVEGYNGRPDDALVRVTLATTVGLRDPEPDGGLTPKRKPTWTRADSWTVLKREFFEVSGVVTAITRHTGYVKDNQLVVRLEKGQLQFGGSGLVIGLESGFVLARIDKDAQGDLFLADGEMGGRWATHAALASARRVQLTADLPPVCQLPPDAYATIRKEICDGVDISADATKDNTGAVCDAVSVSVRFQGAAGTRGALYDVPEDDPCPDAGPGEEDCPP